MDVCEKAKLIESGVGQGVRVGDAGVVDFCDVEGVVDCLCCLA